MRDWTTIYVWVCASLSLALLLFVVVLESYSAGMRHAWGY
jgi:hypothetical protein